MRERVRFYLDPTCPWAWQTAKWMWQVREVRGVEVEWRLFSLYLRNESPDDPLTDPAAARSIAALRTLALAGRELGNDAVGKLYAALGDRIHERKERLSPELVGAALADAGLDGGLLDRALADDTTAAEVRAQHAEGATSVEAFGVPTIVLQSGRGMFGPVVAVAPAGEEAGELWDHVRWMIDRDGFFELKRERDRRPGEPAPAGR